MCAVALALPGVGALAAPDAPDPPPVAPEAAGDAVLQLLHERGLLSAASQGDANAVVHRVRDVASEMVLASMNFLGVRYKLGGDSAEEGFDCSGFTRHIFEMSIGMVLPRRADQQATQAGLLTVKRDELKAGDLVFFNTMRRAFSHVGIYVGDGKFIHAPRTGAEVRVEDMRQAYWVKRYNGARRAQQAASPADAARSGATPLPTAMPSGNAARPDGFGD